MARGSSGAGLWILGLALLALPCLAAEDCRAMKDQRDDLATRAAAAEIAQVRQYRAHHCPALSERAEGANALHPELEQGIDYGAWIRCRQAAEMDLERHNPVRYRNRLGFTYFTREGAQLARQADAISRAVTAQHCE